MIISDKLKLWIAQSESWQTYIDFKLPKDSIVAYEFLKRPDDFYISLFGSLYEVLENPETNQEKILSVAKGLEIYSLQNKRDSFNGVNQANNMLFVAGLYYLANYSSSASIFANIFSFKNFQEDIEKFLLSFLNRKELEDNQYRKIFNEFLKTGNSSFLENLIKDIQSKKDNYFKYNPHLFFLYYLTEKILLKFKENNIWIDLLKQNNDKSFWKEYIETSISKKFPIWDFFPSQKEALEKGLLGKYKSIALQTPTSSGKTAISELIIYYEIKNNPGSKILYLAPFRALASELKQTFGKNLANLNISSKTIYGGNIPTLDEKKAIQDVNLLISTPEKFMAIENMDSSFSNNFSMIICDEGHLLGAKDNRGLSYELLLSKFKKENNKKFVFLSAIVPNIKDINNWLGGDNQPLIKSDYRASEIEYAFLKASDSTNKKFQIEVNPLSEIPKKYILYKFLTEDDLSFKEQLKTKIATRIDSSDLSKSSIIALKSLNSGSVALFSPTKGPQGINGLGKELISQIDKKPNLFNGLRLKEISQDKTDLKEYFKIIFGEEYLLTKIIDYSIVFHHGDLPQYTREVIEDYIREEKIKLVICTNTLAEGVNLPIRTIVIHTTRRDNRQNESDINLRDLKNLFGRAGRAGKETKGLVIIPNSKDFGIVEKVIKDEDLQKVEGYLYEIIKIIHKNIENKKITLNNKILDSQEEPFRELIDVIDKSIIDLLEETINSQNIETEIQTLVQETFAYHQASAEEKKTLSTLIQLRGEKVKQHIERKDFQFIKKSGLNIRLYEELKDRIDLENDIRTNLEIPSKDEWLDFILKLVFDLSPIKYQLKKFNEKNFKEREEKYLKIDKIKKAIILWIQGIWFKEIGTQVCSNNVDISLKLINQFIGYNLQSVITSIINIVELQLKEKEIAISKIILDFPQYLQLGLQSRIELDLVEIGFTDRIGIIELSKELSGFQYAELNELRNHLSNNSNSEQILKGIKNKIPNIVFDKIEKSLSFLKFNNIK